MTQPGAERIEQLARTTFGAQVETKIGQRQSPGPHGWSITLFHKGLRRRISISKIDDWRYLRDAWLAAVEVES